MNILESTRTISYANNSDILTKQESTSPIKEAQTSTQSTSSRAGQRRLRMEAKIAPAMSEELLDAYIKYGNNPDGIPALHAAIKARDEKVVRLFLDHGANPNAKSGSRVELSSALDYAAAYGNANLINLLVDRGAIINPQNDPPCCSFQTPLCCAAMFNNSETIRCLIQRGANIYGEGYDGVTAMTSAIWKNNVDAIKTLVSCGYSLNKISPPLYEWSSPLKLAIGYSESSITTIETILNLGANPNIRIEKGKSVLHYAANMCPWGEPYEIEFFKKIELLIKFGADINLRDYDGKTPLYYAKLNRRDNLVKVLIAHGATE